MRRTSLTGAALALLLGTAQAADYRDEIDSKVLEPCIRAAVEAHGGVGMPTEKTLAALRIMNHDILEKLHAIWGPLVADKSRSDRMALYEFGREQCIGTITTRR